MPHVQLFVYGTLMRGGANHGVLLRLGAHWIADARSAHARTLVDLGPYPALLPVDDSRDCGAPNVHGEVFALDESALPELDAFEGCPTLYVRKPIDLVTNEGPITAFTYVFARKPPERARPLASGRYVETGEVLEHGANESQLDDQ